MCQLFYCFSEQSSSVVFNFDLTEPFDWLKNTCKAPQPIRANLFCVAHMKCVMAHDAGSRNIRRLVYENFQPRSQGPFSSCTWWYSGMILAFQSSGPGFETKSPRVFLFSTVRGLQQEEKNNWSLASHPRHFVLYSVLQLKNRQHFVDSANIYSLEDLIDVNSGSLLPFLTKIHSLFLTHIKSDCQV